MRVVVQRVKRASVRIGGELHSSIEAGLLILLGVEDSDESSDIEWLVKKCANLRIFDDENGVMNRSLIDMNGYGCLRRRHAGRTRERRAGNDLYGYKKQGVIL